MRFIILVTIWLTLFAGKTMDDVRALLKEGRAPDAFMLASAANMAEDADGAEALAWFYDQGLTVPVDKPRAASLFRAAAEKGLKHSQWQLGFMLDTGDGIAVDSNEAFAWFEKSAAQNYPRAFVSLGLMYATGRGTPTDYAKSAENYRRAAVLGDSHGFYGIGVLHALGQGVPKDPVEAASWMTVAHFEGDPQAKRALDNLLAEASRSDLKRMVKRASAIGREFKLTERWKRANGDRKRQSAPQASPPSPGAP